VNENEYNLLMKVDTNTKGNSFWFNFKVYNGRPNSVVTFNVLNFSRDLSNFYSEGMGVQTKLDTDEAQWEGNKCFDIRFEESTDLVRSWTKDKNGEPTIPSKYYYKLKFKYKFD
jgi:hypothetical protein